MCGCLGSTYINGAAHERAFLQGLLDDLEQVGWSFVQFVPLGDASCKVLEAFSGGTPRKGFIAAVDSEVWG